MFKTFVMQRLSKITMLFFLFGTFSLISSCEKSKKNQNLSLNTEAPLTDIASNPKHTLSKTFKDYWYAGKAEISSYKLEQARYGEIREGNAVLIYVTEDFLPNAQVKADYPNSKNIPVLKLNATKNFHTGVYPYSIMQSTFYPVSNKQHAVKVSCSMQEWCGHVYTQLNNRKTFEISAHSYFEGEADKHFKLEKEILENELWTQLRINPKSLPTGNLNIIPSFEYLRLRHQTTKAYKATATLTENSYTINYPELKRTLHINFNPKFPYEILSWEDIFKSGFGTDAKILTTKATKLKTIKSAYWQKNSNKHKVLRDTLKLN